MAPAPPSPPVLLSTIAHRGERLSSGVQGTVLIGPEGYLHPCVCVHVYVCVCVCACVYEVEYRIVRIISSWAIFLTSALNKGWAYNTSRAYSANYQYKHPIPIRAEEVGGFIIHHGFIILTSYCITIQYNQERMSCRRSM